MLIQRASGIPSSEITSEHAYYNRRTFMKAASAFLIQAAGRYDTAEKVTPYGSATTYNNYYEFGSSSYADASKNSGGFKTKPWTVAVSGLVKKPATYDLDDLIKGLTTEDRVYRMR